MALSRVGKNFTGYIWLPCAPQDNLGVSDFVNDLVTLVSLRHLQREMENQEAQANRFRQQMKKLDEGIKQNELLLRRTHMEQKTCKVMLLPQTIS